MPQRTNRSYVKPYVVYVTYPTSSKEYAYLCDIPGIRQGCELRINNSRVTVRRTADHDDLATKWVPGSSQSNKADRIAALHRRLGEIEREEQQRKRWAALTSPEAKRLVRELKELSK